MCVCFSLDEEPLCYLCASGMFWHIFLKQLPALLLLEVSLGAELNGLGSSDSTLVCMHVMVNISRSLKLKDTRKLISQNIFYAMLAT